MSQNESLMANEDEEFIRPIMYIMIGWTIAVVVAGALLLLFQDPLASLFTLAPFGL